MESKMEKLEKKKVVAEFEVKDLLGIGMTLVVLVIGLAFGLQVTSEIKTDMATDHCSGRTDSYVFTDVAKGVCYNATDQNVSISTAEWNGTTSGITAIGKIPEKLPTIVTVIVAAVIIGVLVRYLWGQFASN